MYYTKNEEFFDIYEKAKYYWNMLDDKFVICNRVEMRKNKLTKAKAVEELNRFLFYVEDWLDELVEKAEQQGFKLDYSLDSLKELARFVRQHKILNNKENISDFANCWVYLGEVFKRYAEGAYWTIGNEQVNNMNYGLFFLTGYDEEMSEFIPILYLNNFTLSSKDKLDNNFFYELVQFELDPIIPNLDYLPTE